MPDTNAAPSIIVWCLILVAAILVGFAIAVWVKRRITEPEQSASPGFSLEDLRQLHRAGKLSDEEYERARARMALGLMKKEKPTGRDGKTV
ncbi:MAG TPA: hypothetical protein VHP11_03245 [Tepidisphaeraceae bacterium]|jgi:uncharacterized protein YneF (UPF0154 family)|nr:hypothetical protein [Tepidisphaeraceae bacterium]